VLHDIFEKSKAELVREWRRFNTQADNVAAAGTSGLPGSASRPVHIEYGPMQTIQDIFEYERFSICTFLDDSWIMLPKEHPQHHIVRKNVVVKASVARIGTKSMYIPHALQVCG